MTSDIGVEHVVEKPFLFHCSCGAAIETSEKMVICADCGETIEVRRCVPTPTGKKYTLRISKHRRDSNTEPLLWPLGRIAAPAPPTRHRQVNPDHNPLFRSSATAHPTGHHHRPSPDFSKRYLHLGLLILLLASLSMIAYSVPGETYQEWIALTATPEPRDCDWDSTPIGGKNCHYDRTFRNVKDQKGEHVVVIWQRVSD